MSTRFSEVANSRWCKTCNVQVLPGAEHPNLEAHLAETRAAEAAEARINAKMTATQTMIPVSSNDMMRHISLVSSPETLCGKIVVDRYRPSTTDKVCDTCAELSSSANFVKTETNFVHSSKPSNAFEVSDAERDERAYIVNGIKNGTLCSRCTEPLSEPGEPNQATCDECKGFETCPECKGSGLDLNSREVDTVYGVIPRESCKKCKGFGQTKITTTGSIKKEAINYTRDGLKIEDGFTVITSEEAEVLPFLDTNKVRVARYECPDCETKTHFERLASCEGCGEFKCVACMNTIGNFIGVCAKCAGVDGEISPETLEDPIDTDETFRLLSRLLTEEDEEADPLFLPDGEL